MSRRKPDRLRRTRLRLPGGSARCTEGESAVVEARTVVRRSRSAAGSAPSERARWRPGIGLRLRTAQRPSRRSRSPGEGGDRSRRARGWSGGRRPAAGCRGRATAFGQARGLRRLSGTSPGSPGTGSAGRARPAAGHRGPGPGRLPHADAGTCGGQPVARERSGRPRGLTPGTATAPRGTGGIHRGPVDAGPRGVCAAAGKTPRARSWGEGSWGCWASPAAPRGGRPAAWVPAGAGLPQARCSPSGPAPQRAIPAMTSASASDARAGRRRSRPR